MNKKVLIGIIAGVVAIGAVIGGVFLFKHEHIEVVDGAVVPTCTETGLTEGKHCSDCGEVLIAQQTVAKLPHTEVVDKAVAPTCTKTGLTKGSHCSVCKETLVAQQTVAKLPHTEVIDAAVSATCTATGLTEGKHCSVCEKVLVAQQTVAKLPHTEVIDAAVSATCTATGLTEGKHCSDCGEVLIAQQTVAKLPHTEVIDAAVSATCTTTGLTEGKHCSVCNTVIVAQQTIDKLNHLLAEPITPNSLDVEVTCIRCGETYRPLDHIIIKKEDGTNYTLATAQVVGRSYRSSYYGHWCDVRMSSALNLITINTDGTVTYTFNVTYRNGSFHNNLRYIGCTFMLLDSQGRQVAGFSASHSCQKGDPTYTSRDITVVLQPNEVYQVECSEY